MRVLLISFHFPPDAAIGAVRPYQFARLLPRHGIETWVLTVEPQFAEQRDDRLRIEDIPPEGILRTPVRQTLRGSLINLASSWKSRMRGAGHKSGQDAAQGSDTDQTYDDGTGWLGATPGRRRLMTWLYFPDPLAFWFRPSLATAHQLVQAHQFDAIISTSPPRVAHFVAYQLARRHRIPWIMDLRDPWYVDEVDSRALMEVQSRLFALCARRADVVITNTERLRMAVQHEVPGVAGKTITIPNGADPRPDGVVDSSPQPPQFHIGHYGNVYSARTTGTFMRGLRLWLDRRGDVPGELAVRFFGNEYGDAARYIDELQLGAVVRLCPAVSRHQVYTLMSEDYLLLLLANDQPLQVPGKLYEYFASGRRILATTEAEGAVADLMRDEPGCAIAETPEAVARALEEFWQEFQAKTPAAIDHNEFVAQCSYEHRTKMLANAIKDLVTAPAPRPSC